MQGREWISERILFGCLVIVGYLGVIAILTAVNPTGVAHEVLIGAVGTLGTAVGAVVQACFRTDRVDKQSAETASQLAQAVNTAMTLPAAPGATP